MPAGGGAAAPWRKPEAVRERITGCGDAEALGRRLRRAVTAPSADEVFGDG
ncbi:hypothetical protein [Streptomyces erythrochromogenes]|uniref:hypothetical protein n=1 Tax=Streptomyces erythrochromogenes TaxID=285574 RepID=UPI000B1A0FE7